jgi:predicted nucleotidyltransferase
MTESSNPYSRQPAKPVDPLTCRVLRLVDHAAATSGSRYFVAGAAARDLLLVNAFGLRPGRATRDIDFGIAVENWDQFQVLKRCLMESHEFETTPANTHRLFWNAAGEAARTPIDIIPFGEVASENKTIAWPPQHEVVMNVTGFEEALESSVQMRIEDDLVVRVASIPGLAVLKLIAWQDRRHETNKDAADLHRLLVAYAGAGNLDRIYDQELSLLEDAGYDLELAGSQLLGRDAAWICKQETRRQIGTILSSERLVDHMIQQMQQAGFDEEQQAERISTLLKRFSAGFLTGQHGERF